MRPGDSVEVVGVLLSKYDSMGNARQGFPVFRTFIDANSIKRKNELKMDNIGEEELKEILELKDLKDLKELKELQGRKDLKELKEP